MLNFNIMMVFIISKNKAITGTARINVREDYKKKLYNGMKETDLIILNNLKFIVFNRIENIKLFKFINNNNNILKIDKNTKIILFNSLSWIRNETISFNINRRDVIVKINNRTIETQINFINNQNFPYFQIFFNVNLPPFGYQIYSIEILTYDKNQNNIFLKNKIINNFKTNNNFKINVK
jgi:hypothetical protein